jgi:hypothetical protein
MAQWMELQQWIFPQRFFQENLKLGEGGEEGRDNEIVHATLGGLPASTIDVTPPTKDPDPKLN